MRRIRAWFVRLGGLFHQERSERELAEELEGHLEMHIADNLRHGMSPKEARREALLKLGGLESVKQRYRERRGLCWIENLCQDIRHSVRGIVIFIGLTLCE